METEKSLITILALNVKGQLGRMCAFFGENNINILRLVLSAADNKDIIHRTIAYVEGDRQYVNEVCKKMEKMENVLRVDNFMANDNFIEKELCMVKVLSTDINYNLILNLVYEFSGKMIIAKGSIMIFELIDKEEIVSDFCNKLNRITRDIEIFRSGMLATTISNTKSYETINNYLDNLDKKNSNNKK